MTFLRPWFLLLLLLPLLLLRMQGKGKSVSIWEKLISPELLPYLLVRSKTKKTRHFQIYKIVLWCVLVLGLSGPAWYKTPLPFQQADPSTVIVLELGSTMIGDNLEKAKQKINDILDELTGEQVALVLYDKVGYTAAPLTFDINIIRDMIPNLERGVLPNPMNVQPISGFKKASDILSSAGIDKGRIIYISGGMDLNEDVQKWAQENQNPLGILIIGSMEPHPVALPTGGFLTDANGQLVMLKPNVAELSKLGYTQPMTADKTDVQTIIQKTPFVALAGRAGDGIEVWQDMGGWFVAFCLPFFALLFRKRLMILLLLFTLPAQASLWLRPDQESYLRQVQGVKSYRARHYQEAEELFSSGFNADDLYNWGNALAFQQKIQEAIDAYQQVLDEQPDHQDARFNKEYLEKKLKEQEEEQNPPPPPEEENPPPPEEETQPPPEEQTPPPPEEETPPPPEQEQMPPEEQNQETPPPEEQQADSQTEEQPAQNQEMQEQQVQEQEEVQDSSSEQSSPFGQQSQQILNQLPPTPPSLLKYRLRRQYEKSIRG